MTMIRSIPPLIAAACLALAGSATASTQTVLVLRDGQVTAQREAFSGRTELPGPGRRSAAPRASAAAARKAPRGRATRKAIDDLLAQGAIDQVERDARQAALRRVIRVYASLTGTRKSLLGATLDNADTVSSSGQLTPTRLHPVFMTLQANADWWHDGPLLASGQRVSVGDSPLIWQYYPGQGIQLQMLANFGKANALWAGRKRTALRDLLDDLAPLAIDRGGARSWDYYFEFGGGKPPWTSSISQGTAVQALARAGQLLGDPAYTALGAAGLGVFDQPAPGGVRVDDAGGPFYAIYSFAPELRVLNAHIQALVGLYDFATLTGDAHALALFQQADGSTQALLPSYDTGKWSMYSQERESDLSYHKLVTEFLQNLCRRTAAAAYCDTATRFRSYLEVAPAVTVAAQKIRAGAPARLRFALDKISRVGLVVSKDGRQVFATSATVGRGDRWFRWSKPAQPGLYELRVRATDLAGNQSEPATAAIRILAARR